MHSPNSVQIAVAVSCHRPNARVDLKNPRVSPVDPPTRRLAAESSASISGGPVSTETRDFNCGELAENVNAMFLNRFKSLNRNALASAEFFSALRPNKGGGMAQFHGSV